MQPLRSLWHTRIQHRAILARSCHPPFGTTGAPAPEVITVGDAPAWSRVACIETPRVPGLDGVYLRRKELLVMTDIERRRIVQIAASVKERSVAQALFRLPEQRRVEVVTMDMSASLRRAVLHALAWAVVVADRFHI